jgi:hypothetical protein
MKWLRIALEVIGVSSLVFVAVGTAWILHHGTSERIDRAKKKDVLFILNWGGITTNQDFKIIASYESARSLTGDHLDYYCIDLPEFQVADYAKDQWHDGPEKDPVLAEALKLGLDDARRKAGCLPSAEEANSVAMKILFESVVVRDHWPTAADIILYEPKSGRLYFVSYKT